MNEHKATRINFFDFKSVQMRTFHMAWFAFFLSFFAWFAVAPLMPVIRDELHLTKDQIANINIAAVLVTIFVRLIIGPMCDRFGARQIQTVGDAFGRRAQPGVGDERCVLRQAQRHEHGHDGQPDDQLDQAESAVNAV